MNADQPITQLIAASGASAPSVWALVLNYGSYEDTLGCVEALRRVEYPQLRILVLDNASPDRRVIAPDLFEICRDLFMADHGLEADLPVVGGGDEPAQGVVVALRDGVELVVVAAGAGNGQAEEGFRKDVHLVVEAFAFVLADVDGAVGFLSQEGPSGGEDGFVRTGVGVQAGREKIAGDVFGDETVVGQVGVEGADDVVAILARVGYGVIELMTPAFGVPDEV